MPSSLLNPDTWETPRPLPTHLAKAGRAPTRPVCLSRRERLTWDSRPLRPSPFSFFLSLTPKLNWLGSPVDSSPELAGRPAPLLCQLQGGLRREAWRPPTPIRLTPAEKPRLFPLLQVASSTGCPPGKSLGTHAPLLQQGFLSFMHLSLNKCKVILSTTWCRSRNPHTVLFFSPRGRGDPDCRQQCEGARSCPTLHDPVDCGLCSTRLLCSWDFPGRNTGVGCHFLLSRGSSPPTGADLVCLTTKVDHFWTPSSSIQQNYFHQESWSETNHKNCRGRGAGGMTTMKFVLYFSR